MTKNQEKREAKKYGKNFFLFAVLLGIGIVLAALNIYGLIFARFELLAFFLALIYCSVAGGIFIYKHYTAFTRPFDFRIGLILLIGGPLVTLLTEGTSPEGIFILIFTAILGFDLIFPTLLLKYRKKKTLQKD